jgi:hypothetical protein
MRFSFIVPKESQCALLQKVNHRPKAALRQGEKRTFKLVSSPAPQMPACSAMLGGKFNVRKVGKYFIVGLIAL